MHSIIEGDIIMKTHRTIIKKLNKLDQSMTIGMFKKVNKTIKSIDDRLKKLEEIGEQVRAATHDADQIEEEARAARSRERAVDDKVESCRDGIKAAEAALEAAKQAHANQIETNASIARELAIATGERIAAEKLAADAKADADAAVRKIVAEATVDGGAPQPNTVSIG